MARILVVAALSVVLAGCSGDPCREYSAYTCEQLEQQTYNVYYYDVERRSESGRELFLGEAVGLEGCGTLADAVADARSEEREGDWSYICCLQTDESSCAEKHR